MIEQYAYPWNAPREAIASPYPTYEEMHSRSQMIAALVRAQELLEQQPTLIQIDVTSRQRAGKITGHCPRQCVLNENLRRAHIAAC